MDRDGKCSPGYDGACQIVNHSDVLQFSSIIFNRCYSNKDHYKEVFILNERVQRGLNDGHIDRELQPLKLKGLYCLTEARN